MIEVLVFVPGLVAVMHIANRAFTIYEDGDGHRFNLVKLADFLAGIEQQVAQKLIITTSPRYSESLRFSPVELLSAKSGAT